MTDASFLKFILKLDNDGNLLRVKQENDTLDEIGAFIARMLLNITIVFVDLAAGCRFKLTLNKWRCHGGGPVFIKMGRAVRYRQEDLETFMSNEAATSTYSY